MAEIIVYGILTCLFILGVCGACAITDYIEKKKPTDKR